MTPWSFLPPSVSCPFTHIIFLTYLTTLLLFATRNAYQVFPENSSFPRTNDKIVLHAPFLKTASCVQWFNYTTYNTNSNVRPCSITHSQPSEEKEVPSKFLTEVSFASILYCITFIQSNWFSQYLSPGEMDF